MSFSRMQRMFLIDFFSYSQFFTYTEKKIVKEEEEKMPHSMRGGE